MSAGSPQNDHSPTASQAIAVVALLLAVVGVSLAIVALNRSGSAGTMPAGGSMMTGHGAMSHMAPLSIAGIEAAERDIGGTPLEGVNKEGVLEFQLVAKPVWWRIFGDKRLAAWAYNGIVPGPEIRVRNGQKVRVRFKNELPEETTVHWHGVGVPNGQDGVPDVTQKPIAPGASFEYEFTARPAGDAAGSGTFLYHSHDDEDRQMPAGLYGVLVIEPRRAAEKPPRERTIVVSEWTASASSGRVRGAMQMEGMLPNFFTINGKSFPDTPPIRVKAGERMMFRLVNAGQFAHPLHLHGTAFAVVARDGHPTTERGLRDTITLESGERADIAFSLPRGKWLLHCHIGHHLTNNGDGPGGLIELVEAT